MSATLTLAMFMVVPGEHWTVSWNKQVLPVSWLTSQPPTEPKYLLPHVLSLMLEADMVLLYLL